MRDEITFIKPAQGAGVTAASGFTASGVHCGIRRNKTKRDLGLILADRECAAAGVFTTNKVKAAPILLTMEHLKNRRARAILANSGIANSCAPGGMEAALSMVDTVASELEIEPSDIIVNSTGVIGVPLPIGIINDAIPELVRSLSGDNAPVAEAIMTTDTFAKTCAVRVVIGGKTVTLGGIAKGSGMIHPNMATMFAFLTTDCAISPGMLQKALSESVVHTYNQVSVDGDTSTNDMSAILASGSAGNTFIDGEGEDYNLFCAALDAVNLKLAKDIARDGEGATRLLICKVQGAKEKEAAAALAKSVISSSLVKAAMFGVDANFGRVLCALGYSGIDFDPTKVDVSFSSAAGSFQVCKQSIGQSFSEDLAKKILCEDEVLIDVTLSEGVCCAEAYGCDLTYDYVRINGDYRT